MLFDRKKLSAVMLSVALSQSGQVLHVLASRSEELECLPIRRTRESDASRCKPGDAEIIRSGDSAIPPPSDGNARAARVTANVKKTADSRTGKDRSFKGPATWSRPLSNRLFLLMPADPLDRRPGSRRRMRP